MPDGNRLAKARLDRQVAQSNIIAAKAVSEAERTNATVKELKGALRLDAISIELGPEELAGIPVHVGSTRHATIVLIQKWCTYVFGALTLVVIVPLAAKVDWHRVLHLHAAPR